MDQNYDEMVNKFLQERSYSIEWLNSLPDPAWSNSYNHPELGTLTAEHFLTNWLAHDFLHFRQIIKLMYQHLDNSSEIDLAFAGN